MMVAGLAMSMADASAGRPGYDRLTYQYRDCDKEPATFAYPLFRDDPGGAGTRINHYLHMLFLQAAPPAAVRTGPTPLPADNWINEGATGVKTKVSHSNSDRVVTVDFSFFDCSNAIGGTRSFSFGCGTPVSALDELGQFVDELSVRQLRPYLSSYGLYILDGARSGKLDPVNSFAQIYHGHIGKFPITLYLGVYDPGAHTGEHVNWDDASYFYDKHRFLINLSVAKAGGQFVLEERGHSDAVKPTITFTRRDGKLIGEWKGSGKRLPFEAIP